jgi:hypothetical protein
MYISATVADEEPMANSPAICSFVGQISSSFPVTNFNMHIISFWLVSTIYGLVFGILFDKLLC